MSKPKDKYILKIERLDNDTKDERLGYPMHTIGMVQEVTLDSEEVIEIMSAIARMRRYKDEK